MTESFDFGVKYLKPASKYIKTIVKLGLPSGITQAIFSSAMIIVQSLTNQFGKQFIALRQTGVYSVSLLASWVIGALLTAFFYSRGKWKNKAIK